MTTTTLPARQAAATRPARLAPPKAPYRGLFLEPALPAQADTDEDEDDD